MVTPQDVIPENVMEAIGGKPFKNKLSMVVMSGDFDKVMGAYIIATVLPLPAWRSPCSSRSGA